MRSSYILLFSLLLMLNVSAQEINHRVVNRESGNDELVGVVNREGLMSQPFSDWFNVGYLSYDPDETTISELRKRRRDLTITVVLATWCGDTHEQLPHFFKILDAMRFNERNLELFAIDKNRTAGDIDLSHLAVTRVPTFIFMKGDQELGRIVESPTVSLEKDMLLILMQAD